MNFYSRVLTTFLFIACVPVSCLYGQTKAISDSTFEAYTSNAWDKINHSNSSDSLQKVFAEELFQYYLNNPKTKTGQKAISSAFGMWANTGASYQSDKAMAKLALDSKIWHDFIPYVKEAYKRSDQKTDEDYIKLLTQLRSKLTHPLSKSQVLWVLSKYYHQQDQVEELKAASREMIELNADDFFVEYGLDMLYETESLKVGQIAPNFNSKAVIGGPISLSEFKDRIVLLEFWATWCSPCLPQIPHLKSINSKYSEKQVKLIGISLDHDLEKLEQFIYENNMQWPQILQQDKWSDEITELYNVNHVPRSYIIGKDGKIVAKDLRGEELEKEIDRLMNR